MYCDERWDYICVIQKESEATLIKEIVDAIREIKKKCDEILEYRVERKSE